MSTAIFHDQTIIKVYQGVFLVTAIESFLIDRKSAGLSANTVRFDRDYLNRFCAICEGQSLKLAQNVTADFLRRYFLTFAESHNAGGVHACWRTLRAFFRWLAEEEILPESWKNPMLKVKPPKVNLPPLEPIALEDVKALISVCERGTWAGDRDRAIFLLLLDTGVRAQELCDLNKEDVDLDGGTASIQHGKGGKSRTAFLGQKTRRAMRSHLRWREDPQPALFTSRFGDRLTYDALRQLLERRTDSAGLTMKPTLHAFRRAFAMNMLRNGVDIFALQKLMGHADLQVMRRYLAQNDHKKTFTNIELARVYDDLNCYPLNVDQGLSTLTGEQFRVNSLPSAAIDPSTGGMAITWADDQDNAGCGYEKGESFAGVTSYQVKLITSAACTAIMPLLHAKSAIDAPDRSQICG